MSEHTTLSSYLDELIAKKETLENVDIEARVEEKLSDMRARVTAEVIAEVTNEKHDVDVSIETLKTAIEIVTRRIEMTEDEEEVPEVISDETY